MPAVESMDVGDDEPVKTGECAHAKLEARVWTLSNGTKQIIMQCLCCGDKIGGAIARAKFTPEQLSSMPPLDLVLIEKTRAERAVRNAAHRDKREKQRIEHTQAYYEYLRSPEWRARRSLVMKRDNNLCQGCLVAPATLVHHKNYRHIFDEVLYDLVALCDPCHKKIHGIEETET